MWKVKSSAELSTTIHDPEVSEVEGDDSADNIVVAHNAFLDDKGHLDVTIHVASQRLLASQKLDMSFTFTAYRSKFNWFCLFFTDKIVQSFI